MQDGLNYYSDALNYFSYRNPDSSKSFQEVFAEKLYNNDVSPLLNFS